MIVPPSVPHKFTNDGPGRSKLVCIHANPTFVTEWLKPAQPSAGGTLT